MMLKEAEKALANVGKWAEKESNLEKAPYYSVRIYKDRDGISGTERDS